MPVTIKFPESSKDHATLSPQTPEEDASDSDRGMKNKIAARTATANRSLGAI